MAAVKHGTAAGDDSDVRDEPYVAGSRVTAGLVHERVEEGSESPATVADGLWLDVSDVYEALVHSHRDLARLCAVEAENAERPFFRVRRSDRHDMEHVHPVSQLGRGATDDRIADYSITEDRIVVTDDSDFIHSPDDFQFRSIMYVGDATHSTGNAGTAIRPLSRHYPRSEMTGAVCLDEWL